MVRQLPDPDPSIASRDIVQIRTFGCKANQADSERMRQALEAQGWEVVLTDAPGEGRTGADRTPAVVLLNTCTVTARADAEARRSIRRIRRSSPGIRIVVAGCSAALHPERYAELVGASGVVRGHDPGAVAQAVTLPAPETGAPQAGPEHRGTLVQLETRPLRRRAGGTRGWLSIQDGCDRRCSFCATRLARGSSRSRLPEAVIEEARALAVHHPELAITGIHIGHYGRDLEPRGTLSRLLASLLAQVPGVRVRLGSIEATEVDDLLLDLLVSGEGGEGPRGGWLVPHLHMPLQSGSDPILQAMRRWHTRDDYRRRTLEIAEALAARGPTTLAGGPVLGLGADLITGFPGETDADHEATVRLVEELPFTYLHVFPFSPREGTPAAQLARERPVPQRVAAERARELRELGQARGEAYLASRVGAEVEVVVERERPDGTALGLTEDYLRLPVSVPGACGRGMMTQGELRERERPTRCAGTLERVGGEYRVVVTSADDLPPGGPLPKK